MVSGRGRMKLRLHTILPGFLVLASLAYAQAYEIYVFNHPFTGKIVTKHDKIYAELEPLAVAMKLEVQVKGSATCVGPAPAICTLPKVYLNGAPFTDAFRNAQHKEWFVSLVPFVEATGNKVIVNKSTHIIDIIKGSSSLEQKDVEKLKTTDFNKPGSSTPSNFLDFNEPLFGVSVKYPPNWKPMRNLSVDASDLKNAPGGKSIVSFALPEKDSNSGMSYKTVPPNMSLENYRDEQVKTYGEKEFTVNFTFLGGLRAYELNVKHTWFKPELSNRDIYIFALRNGVVYTLAGHVRESQYPEFIITLHQIADSVRVR